MSRFALFGGIVYSAVERELTYTFISFVRREECLKIKGNVHQKTYVAYVHENIRIEQHTHTKKNEIKQQQKKKKIKNKRDLTKKSMTRGRAANPPN
jgi:hypothetical protein